MVFLAAHSGCSLSENNDFVLSFGVLPASENEQVGSDGRAGVPEPGCWRHPDVLASFPAHVVGAPDHEVVAAAFFGFVLLFVSGSLGPATEHDDVGSADVHRVVKPVFWRSAAYSQSGPHKRFGVKHSDIVEVSLLESSPDLVLGFLNFVSFELEASVNHKIGSDENRSVAFSGTWRWP